MKWDFSFFKNNQVQNEQNNEKVIIRQPNLALLIDADNVSANVANELIQEASRFGNLTIRRIYGDWSKSLPPQNWNQQVLSKHGLTVCQQFDHVKGKDATDMLLIINAMDILYLQKHIDGFVIVSSDSDFTALAIRLREGGKKVIGFGALKTAQAFREACDHFFYVENLRSYQRMINPHVDKSLGKTSPKITDELKNNLANQLNISLSIQNRIIYHLMQKKNQTDLLKNIYGFFNKYVPDFKNEIPNYPNLLSALKALPYIKAKRNEQNEIYISLKMLPENHSVEKPIEKYVEKEEVKEIREVKEIKEVKETKEAKEIKEPVKQTVQALLEPETLAPEQFLGTLKMAFEHAPKNETGWVIYPELLNQVKLLIPSFTPKTYGHTTFIQLLKAMPELEFIEYPRSDGKTTSEIRFKKPAQEALIESVAVEENNNIPGLVEYLSQEKSDFISENSLLEESIEPLENIKQALMTVLKTNEYLQAPQIISEAKKICPKFDDYKKYGFGKFSQLLQSIDQLESKPLEEFKGTIGYRLMKSEAVSLSQIYELAHQILNRQPQSFIKIIDLQKELLEHYPQFSYKEFGFSKLGKFMGGIPNTECTFLDEAKTVMAIRIISEKALPEQSVVEEKASEPVAVEVASNVPEMTKMPEQKTQVGLSESIVVFEPPEKIKPLIQTESFDAPMDTIIETINEVLDQPNHLNSTAEESVEVIIEDDPIVLETISEIPEQALIEETIHLIMDDNLLIEEMTQTDSSAESSNSEWEKLWLDNRKEYCQHFSALFCSYASDLNEFSVYLDELLLTDGQDEHQNDESFWQMSQSFLRQTQALHQITTAIDASDNPTGSAYQFMSHIRSNLAWVLGHLDNLSHYFIPLNAQHLHLNRKKHKELISVSRALNMMAEDFKTDCSSFKTLCQNLPAQNPIPVSDDEALYEEVEIHHPVEEPVMETENKLMETENKYEQENQQETEFVEIDIDNDVLPAVSINLSEESQQRSDLDLINEKVLEIIKEHQTKDEYLSIFLIQKELKLQYLDYGFDRFSNFMKQVPHVEVNPENDYECRWIRDDV